MGSVYSVVWSCFHELFFCLDLRSRPSLRINLVGEEILLFCDAEFGEKQIQGFPPVVIRYNQTSTYNISTNHGNVASHDHHTMCDEGLMRKSCESERILSRDSIISNIYMKRCRFQINRLLVSHESVYSYADYRERPLFNLFSKPRTFSYFCQDNFSLLRVAFRAKLPSKWNLSDGARRTKRKCP